MTDSNFWRVRTPDGYVRWWDEFESPDFVGRDLADEFTSKRLAERVAKKVGGEVERARSPSMRHAPTMPSGRVSAANTAAAWNVAHLAICDAGPMRHSVSRAGARTQSSGRDSMAWPRHSA